MISRLVIVAVAVFVVWKPWVEPMTLLSAPGAKHIPDLLFGPENRSE